MIPIGFNGLLALFFFLCFARQDDHKAVSHAEPRRARRKDKEQIEGILAKLETTRATWRYHAQIILFRKERQQAIKQDLKDPYFTSFSTVFSPRVRVGNPFLISLSIQDPYRSGLGALPTNSSDFSIRISPVISPSEVRETYSYRGKLLKSTLVKM